MASGLDLVHNALIYLECLSKDITDAMWLRRKNYSGNGDHAWVLTAQCSSYVILVSSVLVEVNEPHWEDEHVFFYGGFCDKFVVGIGSNKPHWRVFLLTLRIVVALGLVCGELIPHRT